MLKVTEDKLKTVAFLVTTEPDENGVLQRVPRATVFGVSVTDGRFMFIYFVTGRHCIEETQRRPFHVRVNTHDGYEDIPTHADDWYCSDSADVAILPFTEPHDGSKYDFMVIPTELFVGPDYTYSPVIPGMASFRFEAGVGRKVETVWRVAVGEELFFVSLFVQHAGRKRNLPLVRFGHVSRMPIEPTTIERSDGSQESILGYLAECRSWGGHSGAPVFWRVPGTKLMAVAATDLPGGPPGVGDTLLVQSDQDSYGLLGLVSAHFDIGQKATTVGDVMGDVITGVNSGIAVITPAAAIHQLLFDREDVVKERTERAANAEVHEPGATFDIAATSAKSESELETEFERFESLARQVVRVPKSEIDEQRKDSDKS